jgi:cyclophilin family peptidyl-prolyl cis-trans isomerase
VPDSLVGEGGPNYTIESEFVDTIIHKRGALGMAREGDEVNPQKKSSGSQFYLVVGKKFTDNDLEVLKSKVNKRRRDKLYQEIKSIKTAELSMLNPKIDTIILNAAIKTELDSLLKQQPEFSLSDKQKNTYKTIGGIPHLDGNYTVFGEVTKGMEIVERISLTKTNERDIPIEPIRIRKMVIK